MLTFVSWLNRQEWSEVYEAIGAEKKDIIHNRFSEGMNEAFDWVTKRKKTSDRLDVGQNKNINR